MSALARLDDLPSSPLTAAAVRYPEGVRAAASLGGGGAGDAPSERQRQRERERLGAAMKDVHTRVKKQTLVRIYL